MHCHYTLCLATTLLVLSSQSKHSCFVSADWCMKGKGGGVCEKWVSPIITKILINTRWWLNSLIDDCKVKPPEVSKEQWSTLVWNRASPVSRKMSEHMRGISLEKGSKAL